MAKRAIQSAKLKMYFPYKHVHVVGIGGMGISGLARLLVEQGIRVSGSDRNKTRGTEALERLGAKVTIGEYKSTTLPKDADLVVYTKDEEQKNPELALARKRKIELRSYPQAVPLVFGEQAILGVTGTHGKTTTSGMLGSILIEAGQDPTVLVGSWFSYLKGNARHGNGRFAVFEADEYKRAFLNHVPTVALVTNVEADHLNYFKTIEDVRKAFRSYVDSIPAHGALVACMDDPGARSLAQSHEGCTILYGTDKDADLRATNIVLEGPETRFDVDYKSEKMGTFSLKVPGLHNVRNALGAIAASAYAGVPVEAIKKALATFPGAWRRFEYKGSSRGITVIDDFAHHPTEVEATLKAARNRFGKRKIIAVFQPHFYGRLRDFFSDFVRSLTLADRVIVAPVYFVEGREDDPSIATKYNSNTLAKAVKKADTSAISVPSLNDAVVAAVSSAKKGDVILTIGAGTVTTLGPKILSALKR